jgi:hypothetical protein
MASVPLLVPPLDAVFKLFLHVCLEDARVMLTILSSPLLYRRYPPQETHY